ncbi:hypothetical protein [Pontibacter sp. G13]|uniref:hypothetical protein n=1 Tax=Pontibacter sp. G13 TaxID=3074898 RepID=UPI00288BAE78|nr:hypothetical protein [Pontibacter sp. G13]WNJ19054.1 hypothetical protein RJD25_01065 [Pontibacter sp. G13]
MDHPPFYHSNQDLLRGIIGLSVKSAVMEQYFYQGKLDEESLGTLKLAFTTGQEIRFDCHGDAESLLIQSGGFSDKGSFETDEEPRDFEWELKPFWDELQISQLGTVIGCAIEWLSYPHGMIQSGCKIAFESGDFLYIWSQESDALFYRMNQLPDYHQKDGLSFELIDVTA